jgi:oligopeptide/dipeptide ABC transporter ATP-binding protein
MAERNDNGVRSILELRNLSIAFDSSAGPIHAVRDVSLEIHQSEALSLVGETGCGKSTIALAILSLLHSHKQSGDILYRNRENRLLTRPDWKRIRSREIGIVFQDARSALNPVLTVLDHLIETLQAHQEISKPEARAKGMDLLREVGIQKGQEKLYPFELSGGMCQRVGIALGICNNPRLLIADEPTTAIDSAMQSHMMDLLQKLKEHHHLALLLISHDLPLISQVSDRISVMYHGRIVESGLKDEVLTAPAHPYTQGLLRCQPSLRHHHEENALAAIPGAVPRTGQEFQGCAFAPRCSRSENRCHESPPAARKLSGTRWVACINAGKNL